MGIASLVIGIVGLIMSFIPCIGTYAFLPVIAGLVLGIIDMKQQKQKKQPHGISVAGIVLNAVALIIIIIMYMWVSSTVDNLDKSFKKAFSEDNIRKALKD